MKLKNFLLLKENYVEVLHQSRAPQDKMAFNRITQEVKCEIRQIKNQSINKFLTELTDDGNHLLCKATKYLKRPINQIPPIRKMNVQWARNGEDKAETFAKHVASIFQTNESQAYDLVCENVEEVYNEIHGNFNPKKAPGYDLINGELQKQLPRKAFKLTNLINATIRLRHVEWKVAEVIMILKPGNEITSYRPSFTITNYV